MPEDESTQPEVTPTDANKNITGITQRIYDVIALLRSKQSSDQIRKSEPQYNAEFIEEHTTVTSDAYTAIRMEKPAPVPSPTIERNSIHQVELAKIEKIFGIKALDTVYDPQTGEIVPTGTLRESEVQLQVAQFTAIRKIEAFFTEKNLRFPKFNGITKQPLTIKEKIEVYKELLFSHLDKVKWQDTAWLSTLWPEAKTEEPLFSFLDESDKRQTARCGEDKNGFIYRGNESINSEVPEELMADAMTFYLNHLAFWENKPGITPEKVKEILGHELYEELQHVKFRIVSEIVYDVQRGKGRKLVNALIALDPAMVMPSTWRPGEYRQTTVMTHGVVRPSEWNIDEYRPEYRRRVRDIMDSSEGVRVNRAQPGNVGAFCNPGLLAYGNALEGSKVVFFTDDLLESHASVAFAKYGDGLIVKDYHRDKAIPIPNRVLINPQSTSIEGWKLDTSTTLEYILRLKNELQQNGELTQKVINAGLTYERTILGNEFLQDIAQLYEQLRTEGYSDVAIIGIRDYYTKMLLSSDAEHHNQVEIIKQAIHRALDSPGGLKDLFPQIMDDIPEEGINAS